MRINDQKARPIAALLAVVSILLGATAFPTPASATFIDAFVSAGSGGLDQPHSLVFGPDGNLYVSSWATGAVLRYNGATGNFIDVFVPAGSGGLAVATGLVFGPDGNLYVSSRGTNKVLRYNGATGAFMDAFIPAGSGGLNQPRGLVFGPDFNLYVSSENTDAVLRYNGTTGVFIDAFDSAGSGGLDRPQGLIFRSDGNLYASSFVTNQVLRYNGTTGAFIDAFVPTGSGGLDAPTGLVFGPDGHLYVSSWDTHAVLRYNGSTGDFIDAFVPAGTGGLNGALGLVFGPAGNLYVSSWATDEVLRYATSPLMVTTETAALVGGNNAVDAGLTTKISGTDLLEGKQPTTDTALIVGSVSTFSNGTGGEQDFAPDGRVLAGPGTFQSAPALWTINYSGLGGVDLLETRVFSFNSDARASQEYTILFSTDDGISFSTLISGVGSALASGTQLTIVKDDGGAYIATDVTDLRFVASNVSFGTGGGLFHTAFVEIDAFGDLCTPPEITSEPSSATKCTGESVTFSVTSSGTEPLSYQWRKGGVDIGGATLDSYTIASVVAGDAGAYDVVVSGTCEPSATSMAATLTINPDPVAAITAPASGSVYAVNTVVSFAGTWTDLAGDTQSAQWFFDDVLATDAVTVTGNGTGLGTVASDHTFTEAGVYLVKLTVIDQCGNEGSGTQVDDSEAMVVVYDPSAGFVTGGGWITSPPGAYVPEPSLTGKANFGFVSKYKKGASTPTGETEFRFKAGDLDFHSTSYEWLVIAGARAQYKGAGTINGAGDYNFMLTGIDGQEPGGGGSDKFRLKITDGSGLVYDNQLNAGDSEDPTTVLGGGQIVIHNKAGNAKAETPSPVASTLKYALYQNHPNPFSRNTDIRFSLRERGKVSLVIYDVSGRKVQSLMDGELEAGIHSASWSGKSSNGSRVARGIYFLRMRASSSTDNFESTKRILVVD